MSNLLSSGISQTGQFPNIGIKIMPLNFSKFANAQYGINIDNFLEYRFRGSVVTPISDFSFTFVYPSDLFNNPYFSQYVSEGDICTLYLKLSGQEYTLCTGIIDTIETDVSSSGIRISVMGRDLLGQWEDQGIFTPSGTVAVTAAQVTPTQLFSMLQPFTRTQKMRIQNFNPAAYPVGFSPQESKLQVLSRYLEPINVLLWSDPDGTLVMGRPNMVPQGAATGVFVGAVQGGSNTPPGVSGQIIVNQSNKQANCISIKSTRSSSTIPNSFVPIFSSESVAANQVAPSRIVLNPAAGPSRLASLGHYLSRVSSVSDPSGGSPSGLQTAEDITAHGSLNRLQAYAIRELARENMRELQVQVIVPGHVNSSSQPYFIDQMYTIDFDIDGIAETMYLYEVEYTLSESEGPRTLLMFTRLNTIVAGNQFQ